MYKLLYNYDDFLVVRKHAGVSFHSSSEEDGLFSVIKKNENITSLYPVHRLDKLTSGLILCAKTKKAAKDFSILFQTRKIEKYYISISNKKPKKRQGLISGDMSKARRGSWKLLRTKDNPAKTYFFSKACKNGLRLFLLKPITGKTHQIRVALKSIGSPVLGDTLYSLKESKNYDRGYLHAYALRFDYMGFKYSFVDYPCEGSLFIDEGFISLLDDYKVPWELNWPVVR